VKPFKQGDLCATFDRVDSLLRYEFLTGKFYWKISRGRTAKSGSEAGSYSEGYIVIKIDGKSYKAHRVAHLLMTGSWPDGEPDHENRIRHDNRWENIKDLVSDRSESMGNQGIRTDNSSGMKGVTWHKRIQKWQSRIGMGKLIHLGIFDDPSLAGLTYDAAAKIVWGRRFACLNFPWGDSDNVVLSDRVMRKLNSI
jgi:hypothetical protein